MSRVRGDHNIVVGDVSPDCPGQEPGHTGARELLCSGSRHGARVLREQLITASRPGPRLPGLVLTRVWPVRGKIDLDCETGRGGARKRDGAGRRGGALACKESAGPS